MGLLLKPSIRIHLLFPAVVLVTWLTCLDCAADELEQHGLGTGSVSPAPPLVSAISEASWEIPSLNFRDFFKLPVGPRGLEPTEKLKSLGGRRIVIVGYMVRQSIPTNNFFVLSPLPVSLGDEDESLANDLPASVIFVHVQASTGMPLAYFSGVLRVSGILSLGAYEESDGHVSSVRLHLDAESSRALAERQSAPPIE